MRRALLDRRTSDEEKLIVSDRGLATAVELQSQRTGEPRVLRFVHDRCESDERRQNLRTLWRTMHTSTANSVLASICIKKTSIPSITRHTKHREI